MDLIIIDKIAHYCCCIVLCMQHFSLSFKSSEAEGSGKSCSLGKYVCRREETREFC